MLNGITSKIKDIPPVFFNSYKVNKRFPSRFSWNFNGCFTTEVLASSFITISMLQIMKNVNFKKNYHNLIASIRLITPF